MNCIAGTRHYSHISTLQTPESSISENAHLTEVDAIDDTDRARTLLYRLLAHAFAEPPSAGLLSRMARLGGDDGPVGDVLREIAGLASAAGVEAARAEYDALFIGMARGELLPYASFYLTGFLHERPLARLRSELDRLGLARAEGRSDPEDHIATVCDVMASLIERGDPAQAGFFGRHLVPWGAAFFTDLERAPSACLYRPIGVLGRLLLDIDRQGFAYAADPSFAQGAA